VKFRDSRKQVDLAAVTKDSLSMVLETGKGRGIRLDRAGDWGEDG
jgi:hypothetical protein